MWYVEELTAREKYTHNFFSNEIIEDVLSDFPKDLKNIGVKYDNAQEKKIASDSAATISSKTNNLISF